MANAIPSGKKASAKAHQQSTDFQQSNKYGLYRGETLSDLADWELESNYNVVLPS